MADKTAEAMAKAMGVTIIDDDAQPKDTDQDKKVDPDKDKKDDLGDTGGDAGDQGDQDGDAGGDAGGDDSAGDGTVGDDDDKDSGGDQKDDSGDSSDQGDDKKVIPDSGKSDDGSDQSADFDKMLAERSKGRFTSLADIDKALEEAPNDAFANEQIAKLNEYVKQGGTLKDFVTTQTVDYSGMNAYELIKAQRAMSNDDLTSEEIELLIEDEFGVSESATERDKKIAAAKLKSAGSKALRELKEHQQKWATPLADQTAQREANVRQWEAQLNSAVDKVDEIELSLNKTDTFKFKIEDDIKSKVKAGYKEVDKFFQRYINKDGTEDTARFVRDMIKLDNFDAIVRSAASSSKSQGKKDVVDDIKHPDYKGKDNQGKDKAPLTIEDQAAQHFYGIK